MVEVGITGMGLVTPLGSRPGEILDRLFRGETAARPAPVASSLACPMFAPVAEFDPQSHFPENKTLRLMNRDAQMAVVAARQAMEDATVIPDALYRAEDIALFGATGLSGLPLDEISRLLGDAAAPDGSLDLERFGGVALKRIRPVLSFKILANMPICFVSIFENLRGPNAVYTPWEGQGAQAIAAGVRAIREGEVPCALVGGCDVKTHVLSFITLGQLGLFESWSRHGQGTIPGEGAAFLLLEDLALARRRGAKVYARFGNYAIRSLPSAGDLTSALSDVYDHLAPFGDACPRLVVAGGDGDQEVSQAEQLALERAGLDKAETIHPKKQLGNLFAASAAVQVALAAEMASRREQGTVLANCFGFGSEKAAFLLEGV